MSPSFWHFTCGHGRRGIGLHGLIKPNPATGLSWFTDLRTPRRIELGITSHLIDCDRLRYRYRVLEPSKLQPWRDVITDPDMVAALTADGLTRPDHWWVATEPVLAQLVTRRHS